MADIEKVDQLMQGLEFNDWDKSKKNWEYRRRKMGIPIGATTLWAAYERESADRHFIQFDRTVNISAQETLSHLKNWRGKVVDERHTFNTSPSGPGECPEYHEAAMKGYEIAYLAEWTIPSFGKPDDLLRSYIFDEQGMLINHYARMGNLGPSNEEYSAQFHTYLDFLQSLHTEANQVDPT